jgi:hypothetical protein
MFIVYFICCLFIYRFGCYCFALQERMKIVNKKKKDEADAKFGALIRQQVEAAQKKDSDTANADSAFAQMEDATVRVGYTVLRYIFATVFSRFWAKLFSFHITI